MRDGKVLVTVLADDREWALGTMASSIARHGSSADVEIEVAFLDEARARSWRFERLLIESDLFHWLDTGTWRELGVAAIADRSIVSLHHVDESEPWRCSLPPSRLLVTHSDAAGRQIAEACGAAVDLVLPYGYDPEIFTPVAHVEREACRRDLGLEQGSPFVIGCFANGASRRKNVSLLVEVLRIVRRMADVRLLLTGRGWEAHLDRIEEALGRTRAVWAPTQSYREMRDRYAALDVYLCTSLVEGGPLPALEALACSVPLVGTRVGHIPDLVGAGQANGFVADDAVGLAEAVLAVMAVRPDPAALASSVEPWSWPIVAPRYRAVYEEHSRSDLSFTQRLRGAAMFEAARQGRRARTLGRRARRQIR